MQDYVYLLSYCASVCCGRKAMVRNCPECAKDGKLSPISVNLSRLGRTAAHRSKLDAKINRNFEVFTAATDTHEPCDDVDPTPDYENVLTD